MLGKANHRYTGLVTRLAAVISVVLALTLAGAGEVSAASHVTQALAATTQTATAELSNVAQATVEQPPLPAGAGTQTNAGAPAQQVVSQSAPVAAIVGQASERIAPTSALARGEGREAVATIVHTATTVAGGLTHVAPAGIVRQVVTSPAGDVTRTGTNTVTRVAGASHVVPTLAGDVSTLATGVVHATGVGGRTEHPTGLGDRAGSRAGGAPAPLQTIEKPRRLGTHAQPTAQQPAPAQMTASPLESVMSATHSGPFLARPTAPADGDVSSMVIWTPTHGAGSVVGRALDDSSTAAGPALPSGASVVWSAAHKAAPAPLPASPTPMPTPGGASPTAVVGSGTAIPIVLGLAALLLLAAPPAARRLRLDAESWRLSPFVLIADRPG
jgi:hypothetical protein